MGQREKFETVCISYVPLLPGAAGMSVGPDGAQAVFDAIEALPDGSAGGCLWAVDEVGRPHPILVIPRAREIAEHLKEWAEGDPADWFDIWIKSRGDSYAMVLAPKIKKSVDRFCISYQLRHGLPLPPDARHQVIFRPLRFVTRYSSAFDGIQGLIGETMELAVIDPSVLAAEVSKTDLRQALTLGVFRVERDGSGDKYLDGLLDGFDER